MSDEVLIADSSFVAPGESSYREVKIRQMREHREAERLATAAAPAKRRGRPPKSPKSAAQEAKALEVDSAAVLQEVAPRSAIEEIKPGAVGAAHDRAHDMVVPTNRGRFWFLLRER